MVFPFGKKKEDEHQKKGYVPVNLVQKFASHGMPENKIADQLKRQGFSPGQIDAAIRRVLRQKVTGPQRRESRQEENSQRRTPPINKDQFPTMQMGATQTGQPLPMPPRRNAMQIPEKRIYEQERSPPQNMPPQQAPQQRPPQQRPQMMQPMQQASVVPPSRPEPARFTFEEQDTGIETGLEDVTLEEIIEGIVAEKWQDFEDRLSNFEERDLQLQDQIQEMRNQMKEVEKLVEKKEATLIGRFEEFGGNMDQIQGRIGSIETVFKEFVPDLVRSVKELSNKLEK